MKIEDRKIYIAFDGEEFTSEGACRIYERENAWERLVGLTRDQVEAAVTRHDPDLAEAIERVGAQITAARREAGELKRRRGDGQGAASAGSGTADGGGTAADADAANQGSGAPAAPSSDPDFREVDEPKGDGMDPPAGMDRRGEAERLVPRSADA